MTYSFEKVQAAPVLATVRRLEERIGARFPGRGVHRVAGELGQLVETVASSTASVRGRRSWLRPASRLGILAVVLATATVLILAARAATVDAPDSGLEWLPLLESAPADVGPAEAIRPVDPSDGIIGLAAGVPQLDHTCRPDAVGDHRQMARPDGEAAGRTAPEIRRRAGG